MRKTTDVENKQATTTTAPAKPPADFDDHCSRLGRKAPVCSQCAKDRAFRLWGADKISFTGEELALVHGGSPYRSDVPPEPPEPQAVADVRAKFGPKIDEAARKAEQARRALYQAFRDNQPAARGDSTEEFMIQLPSMNGSAEKRAERDEREFREFAASRRATEEAEAAVAEARRKAEEASQALRELEARRDEKVAAAKAKARVAG